MRANRGGGHPGIRARCKARKTGTAALPEPGPGSPFGLVGRFYLGELVGIQEIVQFLACPACRGELSEVEGGLVCPCCALRFPVCDGIPVLLLDAAERLL